MARVEKKRMDIDVVPYLSIMVIVLKLITLILIVQVIPIAMNPDRFRVLSLEELFSNRKQPLAKPKIPTYFDCRADQVEIIPGHQVVHLNEFRTPGNPIERTVEKLARNTEREYAVLIVRPRSLPVYRHLRKTLAARGGLEVGYDVMDGDRAIDWEAEARKLNLGSI